ncbi:type II toxin-antitoxin system RelE/ParE family toxin [Stenotrophomonas indicatrix]|uniref:type II toxin-antitoxin system RelE/ParE family toxin n=1 Tax=Stenotrophomonas indicatrix TaxID=2045451 RepID=UPI000C190CFC|nr:type II toxin-antitoxin system RelE/ParE family toxin [Stenotrophomonas indicatrix]PII12234.1 hypothetical protein CR918_11170 [Stenotrophomonas indicatrix]
MPKLIFKFANAGAKRAYEDLPQAIKVQFGADLTAVQNGQKPFSAIKDVSASVGVGAIELIENGSPAYRVIYCAKYLNTVYILHAFTKTTNQSDKANMETAELRHKGMMAEVREAQKEEKKKRRGG